MFITSMVTSLTCLSNLAQCSISIYPLKTSENEMFSYVFKGYVNGKLGSNELNKHFKVFFPRHFPKTLTEPTLQLSVLE